jgi:hypothetical protein
MNKIMSTDTSVIARTEEKPTARVFVHTSGRNIIKVTLAGYNGCVSSEHPERNGIRLTVKLTNG